MDPARLYEVYDRDPAPIVAFLEYLREAYGLPRPGTALDMGCGPGRLLAPLASAGWAVTGYEPDPDYAAAAGRRAGTCEDVTVVRGGFQELEEADTFDLIAAVNGPYLYLLDPEARRDALTRCARALRPGGVLFLELSNFLWILRNYREPEPIEIEVDGVVVTRTARHEIDVHRGTFTHHDRFTWHDDGGEVRTVDTTHRMSIAPWPELEFFLRDIGFGEVRTFNGYEEREPGPLTGRRILVSARAPGSRERVEGGASPAAPTRLGGGR